MPYVALAQLIPPSEQPGRERERFEAPQGPRAQPGAVIGLPSGAAPAGAEKTIILIRDIRFAGSTIYSADDLRALAADLIGQRVPLQAVYDLARKITAKYGRDGYVLSRAIVPPQQLNPKGAIIRIDIVEGYIDKVEWPQSLARYRDFFSDYAAKIVADKPANIRSLERYLLLAGELPGLKFSTTIKASTTNPRAGTLIVEVKEKPIDVAARLDNRGTKARGPYQFQTAATFNNFIGAHEALTLSYAGATSIKELQYVAGNYRQVLNSEGLTLFSNASFSWGDPGTAQLRALAFSTESLVYEAGLAYPVIRTRERNLVLSGLFFGTDADSDILAAPFNRERIRGFRVKADADLADQWLGINQASVTLSQGIEGIGSTSTGHLLASRTAGHNDFTKVEGFLSRLQPLGYGFSAFAAAYGQYAFDPLLSPEQCGYGGRVFGRAFDPSQVLGDHCIELLGELRYDIPTLPAYFALAQIYGFVDYGRLKTLEASLGTPEQEEASSVGGGLRLGFDKHFTTDLSVAKGIDGPRDDWRFFFISAAKY